MKIKKSKGAILIGNKKPLIIDDFYFPEKLFQGQVLIELIYSGVCGSQIGEIDGIKGKDKYLPHLLGHEGIGYVLEKHKSVNKVKVGDKVLLHWMPSIGKDAETPKYIWRNKILNAGRITTFNNHAILSENRITKVKNSSEDLDNIMLGCTASTALGTTLKLVNLRKDHSIAVSGCGILGLYIIKILNFLKITQIIAIDIRNEKLAEAKKSGATHIINSKIKTIDKEILKITKKGADFFFECSGNIEVINKGFNSLNQKGTQIFIGVPPFQKKAEFNTLEINLGKKLIGSKGGDFNPDKDYLKFLKLVKLKKLNHRNFITHKIKLNQLNDMIYEMRSRKVIGKPIIVF